MMFEFNRLTATERYKLLTSTIVPRPIALVVTKSLEGRLNAAPFSYFNFMAFDPPLISIGISFHQPGNAKDTGNNIRATGQFVVNLVSRAIAEKMNITAIEFGPEVNELEQADLQTAPSTFVEPPRLMESPVSFECERYVAIGVGTNAEVVLGRVLAVHIDDKAVLDRERCYIDTPSLDLIGRMHGRGWYTTTRERFEVPRINIADWKLRDSPER